jgi:hypothetical protein
VVGEGEEAGAESCELIDFITGSLDVPLSSVAGRLSIANDLGNFVDDILHAILLVCRFPVR